MRISVDFRFSAAHRLPNVPQGHPCRRPHGHNYRVRVVVAGEVDSHNGMVCDFHEIEAAWRERLHHRLDHRDLSETHVNPTAENLALFIWREMERLPNARLVEVSVWETEDYCATKRLGDDL